MKNIEQLKFNFVVACTICGLCFTAANWEFVELGTIQTIIAFKALVIFGFTPAGVVLTYFYFKRLAIEDLNKPVMQQGYSNIKQDKIIIQQDKTPLQAATPMPTMPTEKELELLRSHAELLRQIEELKKNQNKA